MRLPLQYLHFFTLLPISESSDQPSLNKINMSTNMRLIHIIPAITQYLHIIICGNSLDFPYIVIQVAICTIVINIKNNHRNFHNIIITKKLSLKIGFPIYNICFSNIMHDFFSDKSILP